MAAIAASTVCRDVTANWSFICLLPASAQTVKFRERSSDCLETVLACSGHPSDSIGTTSPRIWLTSFFGPSLGRRLVCLLPSSSFSKIPLLVKVIRSFHHFFHLIDGHSRASLRGFSQDFHIAHSGNFRRKRDMLAFVSGFPASTEWGLSKKIVRSSQYWPHMLRWSHRLFQEGFYQNYRVVSFRHILGKMILCFASDHMASSRLSSFHQMVASRHRLVA